MMLAQLFSLQYCLHQPRYWNILNALNKRMDKKNLEYKHNRILWNFKSVWSDVSYSTMDSTEEHIKQNKSGSES